MVALLELLVGLGGITTEERKPQGSPYNGVASVGGFQARTVPSENNDEGYISWHRDKPPVPDTIVPVFIDTSCLCSTVAHGRGVLTDHCLFTEQADDWPLPNYRVIKVLMNFWDVAANGGATAVVPKSVRPLILSRCTNRHGHLALIIWLYVARSIGYSRDLHRPSQASTLLEGNAESRSCHILPCQTRLLYRLKLERLYSLCVA